MEQDKFNQPAFEISDDQPEAAKDKSKKKKPRAADLGRLLARQPEAASARSAETDSRAESKTTAEKPHPIAAPESGQTLNRQQLIELSGTIRFGETSLRRVYEAKLVDETGLRRLVREAYAGHDLRRALAREFLAKELRFERDPRLKASNFDDNPVAASSTSQAAAQTLAAAYDTTGAGTDSSSSAAPIVPTAPPPRGRRRTSVSPWLLALLTLVTVSLAIYAAWLTLTH